MGDNKLSVASATSLKKSYIWTRLLVVCFLIETYQRKADAKTCSCCLLVQPNHKHASSQLSLVLFLCQAATGEPSSLSTTTGPCSFGGAGRAGPPSGISLALPDQAYEATASRQTLRRRMAQRVGIPLCAARAWQRAQVFCFLRFYCK